MPVGDILRFCVVLHIISSFHKCGDCALVIKPQDVVAISGEVVTLNCSSSAYKRGNILWSVTDPGNYIYGHNETSPKVSSYISVSDLDDGNCSLTIAASLAAAKIYICIDLDSEDQASAELTVMENPENCTREMKDLSLHVSCSIVSAGKLAPTVVCEQVNEGNERSWLQANETTKLDKSSNVATSIWNFSSNKDSCNTKITCLTDFGHHGRSRQTIATYCPSCSFDKIEFSSRGFLPNIDDSELWSLPNYDGCFKNKAHKDLIQRLNRYYENELTNFLANLSIICYAASCVALLLTVISYATTWKKSGSAFLLSLCVALIIAYSLFMAGMRSQSNFKDGCKGIVLSLQLFILIAFCILLAEGAKLLLDIISDFKVWRTIHIIGLFAAAWGLPIIIVSVSLASSKVVDDGDDVVCWLLLDKHFIWAFATPVVLIFITAIVFILICLVHLCRNLSRLPKKAKKRNQIRATFWDMLVTCPVLFLGCIFGSLSIVYSSARFLYLSILINSLQGLLIFFFHVLCNKKMNDRYPCIKINFICMPNHSGDAKKALAQEPASFVAYLFGPITEVELQDKSAKHMNTPTSSEASDKRVNALKEQDLQ